MNNDFLATITIEPTNICSLKCPGCPHGSDFFAEKPQGYMKFSDFKKIVDLNKGYFKRIKFIGIGEPFLNRELIDMMIYCSDNNIDVSVHTHGMFVTEEIFKKLVNIKTELRITFSLDGVTNDSYGIYRVGGNFEKVFNNLVSLINFKNNNNLFNIKAVWQFLLMQGNQHELERVKKIAKKIKADELVVKDIIMTGEVKDDRYLLVARKEFVKKKKHESRKDVDCVCEYINPGSVFVLWDGSVVPCCVDYKRKNIMGNAFEKSLVDLWNTEKYDNFRKKYKNKNNQLCLNCRLQY